MSRFLGKWIEPIYVIMRIVVGLLFLCHGAQKLFGLFGGLHGQAGGHAPLLSLIWAAGMIEFVGGLLVAVGLLTGCAAFVASGQMAVAYFMAHAGKGFWPIQNHGELAVLYCFVFLYIAARGAGPYSLDHLLRRRKGALQ